MKIFREFHGMFLQRVPPVLLVMRFYLSHDGGWTFFLRGCLRTRNYRITILNFLILPFSETIFKDFIFITFSNVFTPAFPGSVREKSPRKEPKKKKNFQHSIFKRFEKTFMAYWPGTKKVIKSHKIIACCKCYLKNNLN